MDYNARYYDPLLGKFISPDREARLWRTIIPEPGNPLAWDRYGYAYNNPIMNNDPSGHFTEYAITEWLINYYDGDRDQAHKMLDQWKANEEWWGMLLGAEEGDYLYGEYRDGLSTPK